MQVYRDLEIITARPSPAETARAPHLLYGHVDAAVLFTEVLDRRNAVVGRLQIT